MIKSRISDNLREELGIRIEVKIQNTARPPSIWVKGPHLVSDSSWTVGWTTTYDVKPNLGGLDWIEGDVPTPWGRIHVRADKNRHQVTELRD